MKRLKVIAFNHKNVAINELGKLHFEEALVKERLLHLKQHTGINGLMFLSTCNRVEFIISSGVSIHRNFLSDFFAAYLPVPDTTLVEWLTNNALVFEGEEALRHLFNVASSLDSLVVGEREIITQVRNSFDKSKEWNLTDDIIRIAIRKTIETAKEVYTHTNIATKPVSVVSLAYHHLRELNIPNDARFLFIGAGITNTTMAKFLRKHGYKNFVVFNRTLAKGEELANELGGSALPLTELKNYTGGFDVMITCTASPEHLITKDIYRQLVQQDTNSKIVIDLAVPSDLDPAVVSEYPIKLISVENLQAVAAINLKEREKELIHCNHIIEKNITEFRQLFKARLVELAMSEVPRKVKEIRDTAMNNVFARELEQLDDQSKEVLDKIVAYLEKKYISMPMKLAKEIIIDEVNGK